MPILDKCCFCIRLSTGALILGWLAAVGGILNVIITIANLVTGRNVLLTEEQEEQQKALEFLTNTQDSGFIVTNSYNLIINACFTLMGICLIIGTSKRDHRLVKVYLIGSMAYIVLSVLFNIYLMFGSSLYQNPIAAIIIGTAFGIYFWLCVYSLYQEIIETAVPVPADNYLMRQQNEAANKTTTTYALNK